jgi:formylglycine-generating enzyme required for sulfatase activity
MFQPGCDGILPLGTGEGNDAWTLVWIAPGTFRMGNPRHSRTSEDGPQFDCTLTHGYWVSQYPVTQAQWGALMGTQPSVFPSDGTHPVEHVTWDDAVQFCAMMNTRYHQLVPSGYAFALPTEAHWEHACQLAPESPVLDTAIDPRDGGLRQELERIAWYQGNSARQTHPVGLKAANRCGLSDMLGNVFEWCVDSFGSYPDGPMDDWIGRDDSRVRSVRGGSWAVSWEGSMLRPWGRGWVEPDTQRPWLGFRLSLRWTDEPPSSS